MYSWVFASVKPRRADAHRTGDKSAAATAAAHVLRKVKSDERDGEGGEAGRRDGDHDR